MERLVFSSHTTFPNTVAIELAERLVELTPGSFEEKVWFGLTGSDANELIYKIMPVYSRRKRMLGFQGSYHGQTMGALSLSGHKALTRFIGFPNVVKAPYPYCYLRPSAFTSPFPAPAIPLASTQSSQHGPAFISWGGLRKWEIKVGRCDVYGVLVSAVFSLNSTASHISSQTSPR